LTELLYDTAIERAKYLDSLSEPVGPLHGLPFSLKEHLHIKGYPCNAGFAAWIAKEPPTKNNTVYDILVSLGAIPLCRTTQPQTLMHLSSNNMITGKCYNPYNRTLTSGGSSGGEGSLIAMKGSVLGLGTDIGGSVRGPSANCGIYGLRETASRVPCTGMNVAMKGAEAILGIIGPITRSVRDIELFFKNVIATEPWKRDTTVVACPWRKPTLPKKINVAFMWDDGVVVPHPPVTRALKEVKAALEKYPDLFGISDWKPLNHAKHWEIVAELYFMDGGADDLKILEESGEPWDPLTEWILTGNKYKKDHTITEAWAVSHLVVPR
jgi:amidase